MDIAIYGLCVSLASCSCGCAVRQWLHVRSSVFEALGACLGFPRGGGDDFRSWFRIRWWLGFTVDTCSCVSLRVSRVLRRAPCIWQSLFGDCLACGVRENWIAAVDDHRWFAYSALAARQSTHSYVTPLAVHTWNMDIISTYPCILQSLRSVPFAGRRVHLRIQRDAGCDSGFVYHVSFWRLLANFPLFYVKVDFRILRSMSHPVASPEEYGMGLGVLSSCAWSTVDTSLCVSPVTLGRNSHTSCVEVDPVSRGPGFFFRCDWFDSGNIFCVSLTLLDDIPAFSA